MTKREVDMDAALEAVKSGRSFAEFLGFSPNLGMAIYAGAVNQYETAQYAEAIGSLKLLVMLDARNADAWSLMGNALFREGQFPLALEAWQTALSLKPSYDVAATVARTAVALKNPDAIADAMLVLVKHLTTPQRVIDFGAFGDALRAMLESAAPAAAAGDRRE